MAFPFPQKSQNRNARLTHRSTPTLPLRVTNRHQRSDFSSLTFRAASAAPVNSIR